MTREEATKVLDDMKVKIRIPKSAKTQLKRNEALEIAIQALEHPEKNVIAVVPCGDAVSRQAVKLIHGKCNQCKYYEGVHNIQGHAPCRYHKIGSVMWDWYCSQQEPCEDVPDINDGNIYVCPCGYGWDKSKVVRHHFCPNCGAKVAESEEV